MQQIDWNIEAYNLVKKQLRNELLDSRGDHTTNWYELGQNSTIDAEQHINTEEKIIIHCPVPKICCDQRKQGFKYGCMREDRDCALNMMFNTNFDDTDDENDVNDDEIEEIFIEDDPIEYDH